MGSNQQPLDQCQYDLHELLRLRGVTEVNLYLYIACILVQYVAASYMCHTISPKQETLAFVKLGKLYAHILLARANTDYL